MLETVTYSLVGSSLATHFQGISGARPRIDWSEQHLVQAQEELALELGGR